MTRFPKEDGTKNELTIKRRGSAQALLVVNEKGCTSAWVTMFSVDTGVGGGKGEVGGGGRWLADAARRAQEVERAKVEAEQSLDALQKSARSAVESMATGVEVLAADVGIKLQDVMMLQLAPIIMPASILVHRSC